MESTLERKWRRAAASVVCIVDPGPPRLPSSACRRTAALVSRPRRPPVRGIVRPVPTGRARYRTRAPAPCPRQGLVIT